jgi:hypothetical protein
MKRLYIGSINSYSGKSFLTLGLGLNLKDRGLKIGYIKPIGKDPVIHEGRMVDADALFFQKVLSLQQSPETISPFIYTIDTVSRVLSGRLKNIKNKVIDTITSIKNVDILLIAGTTDIFEGSMFGVSGVRIVQIPKTKAIIVESWRGEESIDDIIAASEILNQRLAGVVINRVKKDERDFIEKKVRNFLKRKNIKLFGVIAEDPLISAVTIKRLVEVLGARVLCCKERLEELVENFSIGAMDVNNALKYFRVTPNKAVITGAHRTDIQMAALETSTKCIILTGGLMPNEVIISRAEEKGVPLLSVRHDTFHTVDRIESLMGKSRIRDIRRVDHIKSIIKKHVNISSLLKSL